MPPAYVDVLASIIRIHITIIAFVAEPLDCSLGHILKPSFSSPRLRRNKKPLDRRSGFQPASDSIVIYVTYYKVTRGQSPYTKYPGPTAFSSFGESFYEQG